ncbi:MAG: fibronectin type III domain-containing protein [Mogibacterium sp.]|nr:fibronectin type III domain-containing protein [Mogibacterium sp.]
MRNKFRAFSIIMLTLFALVLSAGFLCSEVQAEDTQKATNIQVFYWADVKEGCELPIHYENSAKKLSKAGDEWQVSIYDYDVDPYIYVENDPMVTFASENEAILKVTNEKDFLRSVGKLSVQDYGTCGVTVHIPESDTHEDCTYRVVFTVIQQGNDTGSGNSDPGNSDPGNNSNVNGGNTHTEPKYQSIYGNTSFAGTFGKSIALSQSAATPLTFTSSNTQIATVDGNGRVRFKRPGSVRILVRAAASDNYYSASKSITVKSIFAKPSIKCTKKSKKTNKITWSKVPGASGYELYIKYPGSKKYVKALTKNASVKSVTHRGLTRGRKYRYKVRAFVKAGGKKYYSLFSKPIAVKVK